MPMAVIRMGVPGRAAQGGAQRRPRGTAGSGPAGLPPPQAWETVGASRFCRDGAPSRDRNLIGPHDLSCTLASTIGVTMIRRFIGIATVVAAVALPVAVQAQGVPGGVERGSRDGERAAGPVGAVVGGVIGGVVGGVAGVLGVDQRPRFHSYVAGRHVPSSQYREAVRVVAGV